MASTASMPSYMLPGVSVYQPSHLEGDAALATEILPGPPSLVSTQQAAQKRDPRKPSTAFSYLPHSDPGSTYSGIMHGTLVGQEFEGPRIKRTRVDKGTATGRAQRASARNQNGATSTTEPQVHSEVDLLSTTQPAFVDTDAYTMVVDDEPSLSRSNSSHNLQEPSTSTMAGRARRKDKGKGKDSEPPIRVKEEPKAISLHSPEPSVALINNDDHCSSCRSHGALVYCDGCPRAFHLWCLDPPMESVDEGDSRWFCPSCMIRKHPPRKPPPSFLSPLIQNLETTIPTEFQLPDDVRTFFKDVATGPKGNYIDSSEIKQPRLNRHGQLEDRDAHRLRDRNGAPILCFRCGTSALPGGVVAAAPAAKRARRSSSKAASPDCWKSIVSCDYCTLHWHLDCLDPPLSTMPSFDKKWMCPNHADQVLIPKRRIPKQNVPLVDITKPKQFNNGNIEVSHPESAPRLNTNAHRVAVDEVLINGRRYRVPERVIVLDFWSKVKKNEAQVYKEMDTGSGMSSPLTSLSSLDDLDDRILPESRPTVNDDAEDLKAAQMLCTLQESRVLPNVVLNGHKRKTVDSGVQTDPEQLRPARGRVIKPTKASTSTKRSPIKISGLNGSARSSHNISNDLLLASTSTASTTKRRKAALPVQAEPSTRELRSRSKNNDTSLTSISSRSSIKRADDSFRDGLVFDGSMSAPPLPLSASLAKSRSVFVKLEEADNTQALVGGSSTEAGISSTALTSKVVSKRTRTARRTVQNDPEEVHKPEKEKRGRKRKVRDDDALDPDNLLTADPSERPINEKREKVKERKEKVKEKGKEKEKEKEKNDKEKKAMHTPIRQGHAPPRSNATHGPSATQPNPSLSAPTTPSLKIRLPRLSNVQIPHASPSISSSIPSMNIDTPTRP